ncbi:uncharacterized protein EV422DRAFT_530501 [Fimicolochytrium jonesii]|uniref:uncharacterized protein n=1 Tax=Fimicolochytrium jonesii TaxID=1396493 RepID=UPI0022FE2616|nr:uncharacterized protein EV422DRAFT_530501 [Fimicolochytrium jonesii]KAI8820867.1 hypothetical protein EV422DRAFT_530501 [Fimicolochytrium jonesii]
MLSAQSSAKASSATTTTTTHPQHQHLKIQTESKHDIAYLRALLAQHALTAVDSHSNPQPKSKPQSGSNAGATPAPNRPQRTSHTTAAPLTPAQIATLETHITHWLNTTFALASHSILINGISYADAHAPLVPEYEAVDERLKAKCEAAEARVRDVTARVARLRREVPGRVGRIVEGFFAGGDGFSEEVVEGDEGVQDKMDVDMAEDEIEAHPLHQTQLLPHFKTMLPRTLTMHPQLARDLPALTAKLARAQTVLNDLAAASNAINNSNTSGSNGNSNSNTPHSSPPPTRPASRVPDDTTKTNTLTPRTARTGLLEVLK